MPVLSWLIAILMGACFYAGSHFLLHHIHTRQQQARKNLHLYFSIMCFSVAGFMAAELVAYQSVNPMDYVLAYKWRAGFALFTFTFWSWFVYSYTGVGSKKWIWPLSLYAFIQLIPNIFRPYGEFFDTLPDISLLTLPWGEQLAVHVVNKMNFFGLLVWSNLLLQLVYSFYAAVCQYHHGQQRQGLMLLLGLSVSSIFIIETLLVRLGLLDYISLGSFSFPALLLVMSIALHQEFRQRIQRLSSILDHLPAIVYMKDNKGKYLMVNHEYEVLFNISNNKIVGQTDYILFDEDTADTLWENDRKVLKQKQVIEFNEEVKSSTNELRTYHSIKFPIFDSQNNAYAVCGISTDITASRRVNEALRSIATGVSVQSGKNFYQQMVIQLGELFNAKYAFIGVLDERQQVKIIALSEEGRIVDNFSYLLKGTPCENVVGQLTSFYPAKVQELFPDDHMLQELGLESYIGAPLFDANNNPIGLMVVMDTEPMHEISRLKSVLEIFAARAAAEIERVKAEDHIRQLAFNDYLTGLSNRAALHEYIRTILITVKENSLIGAMLLIDLDHFKTINDALSHEVGDQVLKMVADRLQKVIGQEDFVARIGGDEFVVVILREPSSPLKKTIETIAHKVVDELSKPLHLDKRILNIGASVGVVLFPEQAGSEGDIMRRADMALYQAKNKGRGLVQFYQAAMQQQADERLQIERGLRHAIEKNELSLHYQPQLDIYGELIGVEALLRWNYPKLGQVPPDNFIPVAEETGLIHAIGDWVFHEACRQYKQWQKDNIPFNGHISINVSAWQFAAPEFVGNVIDALSEYHLQPEQIVLELTETALLKDVADTQDKLLRLDAAGIQVALDDFGTGYSSLAYLKDMPMQILKIDRAFISELTETNDHPLVETIIDMGKHMELDIIAEGVENEIQRKILIELGCEVFQGYYFSRPLAASDFVDWLYEHDELVRQRL